MEAEQHTSKELDKTNIEVKINEAERDIEGETENDQKIIFPFSSYDEVLLWLNSTDWVEDQEDGTCSHIVAGKDFKRPDAISLT